MSEQEKNQNTDFKFSDAIFLALASTSAYLLAFFYEKGFADFFRIPSYFINLNLINVFSLGAVMLGAFTFLFPLINLLTMIFFNTIHPVLVRAFKPLLILALLVAIQYYLFGQSQPSRWGASLFLLVIFAVLTFFIPLITQKSKKGYFAKLEAQEVIDRKVVNIADYAALRFGPNIVLLASILLFSIFIAQDAGTAQAIKQTEYLVTNTSPEMVVLRVYGDNFICAPFDRTSGKVQNSFVLFKVSADPGLVLTLEKVGPLHPVELMSPPVSSASPTAALATSTSSPNATLIVTQTITPTLTTKVPPTLKP